MNKVHVNINIFPEGVDLNNINNYDESIYGKEFSNLDEIRVNQTTDGYSILYTDRMFERIETSMLGNNIIDVFTSNLPDTVIEIQIYYYYFNNFRECIGVLIIGLDEFFTDCENEYIDYRTSKYVDYIIDHYDEDTEEFVFDEDEDDEEDDDEEDDEDDEEDDEDGSYYMYSGDVDDPFQFPSYRDLDLPKSRKMKKLYGVSQIMESSKHAKRDIKRHMILISSNKRARKRDEKILKEFIKDFIPGNSKWIKGYRAEILERWMLMYAMPKKMAKELSKEHKTRYSRSKKSVITKNDAITFTQKLLKSYDPFYDPNR